MSGFYGFHYDDCCVLGCDPVIWQECTHYAVLHDSEDLAAPIIRVDDDGGGKVLCTVALIYNTTCCHISANSSLQLMSPPPSFPFLAVLLDPYS